jgi:hypothetical protein
MAVQNPLTRISLPIMNLAKTLLVLSIVCMVVGGVLNIGWMDLGSWDALYTIFPLGAVFFGLFLIVKVLENERSENEPDRHLTEPSVEGPAKPLPPQPQPTASSH